MRPGRSHPNVLTSLHPGQYTDTLVSVQPVALGRVPPVLCISSMRHVDVARDNMR